jgi:hypothetical protein
VPKIIARKQQFISRADEGPSGNKHYKDRDAAELAST